MSSVAPAPLVQSATDKIVYGLGALYLAHAHRMSKANLAARVPRAFTATYGRAV